jgi:SAM-dependent methyltransferase
MADRRRSAPAAQRNRDAILAVLAEHLPRRGLVLEVASGSGEHAVHFATHLPHLDFQPSDPDPAARASIDAWSAEAGLANLRFALDLDAAREPWPIRTAAALLCINMAHIAPWPAVCGLMSGAGRILGPGGVLYLYGPYKRDGQHTAPSNAAFDETLRARNAAWGVRDLEAVAAEAAANGFAPPIVIPMPANNFSLVFCRHDT